MIDPEKLSQITTLDSGAHDASGQMCAMEAAAWIAGEPWSDHPQCVSPVISAFMRSWNDDLPDAARTRLLLPLLPEVVGTRTTDADDETRAWMATDWIIRVETPAWLRLAGLTDHAGALESCARIVDAVTARAAQPKIDAAVATARAAAKTAAADAAVAAVRAAAWDAVRAAAVDAAVAAAWATARAAAVDAAVAAAWATARAAAKTAAADAAWDAVRAAAWDAAVGAAVGVLSPTVSTLQESAVALVREMCAVGRVAAAEADASHGARATQEAHDER